MVDPMKAAPRCAASLAAMLGASLCALTLNSRPARAADPCVGVETEPAVTHATSISINASEPADMASVPTIFNWETATLELSGQVNVNRSKYQDSVCFLFFCHDVTRIRDNFVGPAQYPVTIAMPSPDGKPVYAPTTFNGPELPVPVSFTGGGAREQVQLRAVIAAGNAGIVRQDCAADPGVCSSGAYSAKLSIRSGTRAKNLVDYLSGTRSTYAEIVSPTILNANLRGSSAKVLACVARGLLVQANAFHGPGTGESPAERQQILQEALALSPDDNEIKTALAATYVETGQYAQARSTDESTVTSVEKQIQGGQAEPSDYDNLAQAYATLAEVDWREVAGVSTAGVANGVAHLRMAIDRTDTRLGLDQFGPGADVARNRRAGSTVRLSGMLARQGTLDSVLAAAAPLKDALELLPEVATGVPLATDVIQSDLITSIPIERLAIDRAWSETRTDVPLSTEFQLSKFAENPFGAVDSVLAWSGRTGEAFGAERLGARADTSAVLLRSKPGCRLAGAVGLGADNALALSFGGETCTKPGEWTLATVRGSQLGTWYPGAIRSLAVSGPSPENARRVLAVTSRGLASWIIDKDGLLAADKDWKAADWQEIDDVRAGPNPSRFATRTGGAWRVVSLEKEGKTRSNNIVATQGPTEDVAFLEEGDQLLALGSSYGLARAEIPAVGEAGPIQLTTIKTASTGRGAWPVPDNVGMRFAWAARSGDPVAVLADTKGGKQKLLVFARQNGTSAPGDVMSAYSADLDPAFSPQQRGDFRVVSVALEPRGPNGTGTGSQGLWPHVSIISRGLIGTLLGTDLQLARPIQKSRVVNASDFSQLRRGKSRLWALASGQTIAAIDDGPRAEASTGAIGTPEDGQALSFEVDEKASLVHAMISTAGTVEKLGILPLSGDQVTTCGISAGQFKPGVCTAEELAAGLGAQSDEQIVVVSYRPTLAEKWTRPAALAVRRAGKTELFPLPLGSKKSQTFPVSRTATLLAVSDGPTPTLFAYENGKIAASTQNGPIKEAAAPDWTKEATAIRLASAGSLLVAGGSPYSFKRYERTETELSVTGCDALCPVSPDQVRSATEAKDLVPPSWPEPPSLTASPDLSTVAFLATKNGKLKLFQQTRGASVAELVTRPGLPLLYSAGTDEDIVAIRAGKTLLEQWTLKGTGIPPAPTPPPVPSPPVEQTADAEAIFVAFFAERADQPLPTSAAEFPSWASCIASWGASELTVSGYTSSRGSAAANVTLSQKRAEHVANELVRLGVPSERLKDRTVAHGEQGAVDANPGFGRRVEVRAKGQITASQRQRCADGLPVRIGSR